jgi:quercetin dioxygenase-like cupin family protein
MEEPAVSEVRRIVTGHDSDGKAVVVSDGAPPRVIDVSGRGTRFHEVWRTMETPARIERVRAEPPDEKLTLAPPRNGVRIRVVDFPPETEELASMTPEMAKGLFAQIGAEHAATFGEGGPHPFMHRTETVDYGIVLEGEITLVLDKDETLCRAGDIVIQNGTNHAWANRSGKPARMAFVLIDGQFSGFQPT